MRTDIAIESRELFADYPGVHEDVELRGGLRVSRVKITTDEASRALDKPKGRYFTLTAQRHSLSDAAFRTQAAQLIAGEMETIIGEEGDEPKSVMVVGLGNRFVTPDALGPKVAEHVFVTRHIQMYCRDALDGNVRTVTAFAANVLGITGMETVEVVSGLVQTIHPDLLIIVDALASMESAHIGSVIQMNDSGISPGSGIGNFQTALNDRTVGVPVITLGVPLVVSAETIIGDALDQLQISKPDYTDLPEEFAHMIVTPKNIDAMVADAAKVLAEAINLALHGTQYRMLEQLLS
ncbi:MAG: GPR endopeptidase [Clostridiales bacterium]|nr:GPR endopeptidase [Clostridiales bacterium]